MDHEAVADWLLSRAREMPDMLTFAEQFRQRLLEAGLDFQRFSLGYQTLHPEIAALAFVWEEPMAAVSQYTVGLEIQGSSHYLVSPVRIIHEGGDMVRCRLEGDDPDLEYAFLEGLMANGYTDYLMLGVPLSGRRHGPLMVCSRRPGGFSDAEIEGLKSLRSLLGLHIEIHASHHLAGSLLDVYIGHGTGERVLAGAIRRGSVQRINAALLFCDLRDFTALSERLPRDFIVRVLNDYFGEVGAAVDDQGGEILKFIGDAALAIFPVEDGARRAACDRAMAAARGMLDRIVGLNARRAGEDKSALEIGIGLHVGEVWYGNIGAAERLDFTVIGPAVNRAARLEKLAGELGETVLVSADFADTCSAAFDRVGAFPLKGIEGDTPAYRPVSS
ncbi:MAG: adenylate/guanylate cyclase domain-containing protein [Minwuia sp.]|uniref:adenylate/guanylate cyclase domain-containing protein n=1 Tax=Minwuia sp. TaxID=2493630 RepID=UPI003A8B8C82